MMNKKIKALIIYVVGILTPFVLVFIMAIIGIKFPKSKAEIAFSEWRIDECNETFLFVGIPSEPNIWFAVGIDRDLKTRNLKDIDITMTKKGETLAFFRYEELGIYGFPKVSYGFADKGLVWRDLNFDSRFDERIDYMKETIAINIDDIWVPGTGKGDIKTKKGIYRFDPNAGEWKLIEANPIPENQ